MADNGPEDVFRTKNFANLTQLAEYPPEYALTNKPASTAIKILISVPASTYSVLAVSLSPKRIIDFAAISSPNASYRCRQTNINISQRSIVPISALR